jgi:isopentenyl phosphate kinase
MMTGSELVFLKLGGSLITDKDTPRTPRSDILARLAAEIGDACRQNTQMQLVLGHGSGSFGHTPASRYGTRQGVRNRRGWLGFAEVWKEARALNQLVVEALETAGLPVIAFPPSAAVTARDGQALRWDLHPLRAALDAGLLPLVNGDTIFDEQRGGTILSTEDLFIYLARELRPRRILLAGREEGVWADYPACTHLVAEITPANYGIVAAQVGGSASVDVTGGMLEKVRTMLDLTGDLPGFEARIFSGLVPGLVRQALLGANPGTGIRA